MRHSDAQRILAANLVATTADIPSFADTILAVEHAIGLPRVVPADTGLASGPAVAALEASKVKPLVAIGRTQLHRPYDFRPPPAAKGGRQVKEPWRIAMKAKLETDNAKAPHKKRKQLSSRCSASSKVPRVSCDFVCAAFPTSPPNGSS